MGRQLGHLNQTLAAARKATLEEALSDLSLFQKDRKDGTAIHTCQMGKLESSGAGSAGQ